MMADVSLIAAGSTACALSAVFGWVAMRTQRAHRAWCDRATKADGVVSRLGERRTTGLSEDASGMSTGTHFTTVPVVRFRANGIEYEIDAPEVPAEIGTPVQVAYEPGQPSGARAVVRTPKVGCSIVLVAAGIFLIVVGLLR